jgi:uncharacterized membrane protein
MFPELAFLNLLWVMWILNLVDAWITERGVRLQGYREDNMLLSSLVRTLGWGWFVTLKLAAVSWLFLYLFMVSEIRAFRPFAWISAILAAAILAVACMWNAYLVREGGKRAVNTNPDG